MRRKRGVENALRALFEGWGYDEVQTPGIERFDVMAMGLGQAVVGKTFLFNDRDGVQLALRPEITTPIARLVSARMRDAPLPIRLSYVQTTYRYEEPQEGRMREFTQAGLELIGPGSIDADAESLCSAIEALDAVGLDDTLFDVNHAAIVQGVLRRFDLDDAQVAQCSNLIARRSVVRLREALRTFGRSAAIEPVVRLATARGGADLLQEAAALAAGDAAATAIARVGELLERARARGYGARVGVDLAMLRDFSYYTGFVFKGFAAEVGYALCGGGRYDALLPAFGFKAGAVGWSASIERLLLALERRSKVPT